MNSYGELMTRKLKIAGLAERSVEMYFRAARLLFESYPGVSPSQMTEDHVCDWFLGLKEKEYASGTLKIMKAGAKFFFTQVIPQPKWTIFDDFKVGKRNDMRPCLSVEEAWRALNSIRTPHNRAALTIIYLCGLRISECVNLQIGDIHGSDGRIHVHRGKGAVSRYIPLPEKGLQMLRNYYKTHRHETLIFPAVGRGAKKASPNLATKPMTITSIQSVFKKVLKEKEINKRRVSVHSLRHSYASHLIELGVPLEHVRIFMGHSSLVTTAKYIHVTKSGLDETQGKINKLADGLS